MIKSSRNKRYYYCQWSQEKLKFKKALDCIMVPYLWVRKYLHIVIIKSYRVYPSLNFQSNTSC